jgi:hypothetical protein
VIGYGDGEEETSMSTSMATKRTPEMSSGLKTGTVVVFYLLTLLTGGFFLFVGGKLSFVVNLTAATFYIAVTLMFHVLAKGHKNRL